ncbi:YlaI family protein [Rossellomorea aquimaris]|uniref:YlaI family protein n=1 Tax=Rossellomorea aquimaris TaxID=189382 RepID=UPI0007D06AAF|nr:YlaI family protein [Rossellomorea aquimaris]
MRVKCALCEVIDNIDDYSLQAKRLRNRPIHTYMCDSCHDRIKEKTEERVSTGNFKFYKSPQVEDEF